jgi:cell division protein FtsB
MENIARLTERHKTLQAAIAQDALMQEDDIEANLKEFEEIIKRSDEIPQEVVKLKNERGLLIT